METVDGAGAGSGFTAPYIPFKTLLNLIQRMADEGMPDRIDRTYLGNQSGVMQTYLIKTLKSLELIRGEQGEVTDTLRELVSQPEARPELVGNLLRRYYPEAMSLGQGATHGQLEEKFAKHYDVSGDTKRKAITFFLNAAQFAGVPVSPHFKMPRSGSSTPRARTTNGQRRTKRRSQTGSSRTSTPTAPSMDSLRTKYVEMLLEKADKTDELDSELLDRIESLLGFDTQRDEDEPED